MSVAINRLASLMCCHHANLLNNLDVCPISNCLVRSNGTEACCALFKEKSAAYLPLLR